MVASWPSWVHSADLCTSDGGVFWIIAVASRIAASVRVAPPGGLSAPVMRRLISPTRCVSSKSSNAVKSNSTCESPPNVISPIRTPWLSMSSEVPWSPWNDTLMAPTMFETNAFMRTQFGGETELEPSSKKRMSTGRYRHVVHSSQSSVLVHVRSSVSTPQMDRCVVEVEARLSESSELYISCWSEGMRSS